ncbi:polysaccharide export protein [Salmonella enterica subsp. enterica]|nr:polysaccharide export protein [Salmonella enterica subsp. enterica serovar Enteritidis]
MAMTVRMLAVTAACALVASCGTMANNGPVAAEVKASAANGGRTAAKPKYVFDIVDVSPQNAKIAAGYQPAIFNNTFGMGKGGVSAVIGVGDKLQITIFEAGPDGIFSTADAKSTTFPVTVQPDGRAAIPYVGPVRFAGRTIEGVRGAIVGSLRSKAVEPDVIVSMIENGSRTVTVNGQVGRSAVVPLGLRPEKVLDVLAMAGGAVGAPYETSVTMTRGGKTGTVMLQTLVREPAENVYVRPDDIFFVGKEPQSFTVLGSSTKTAKVPFEAESVNLVEAVALAGGANVSLADPANYFVFRYEYPGAIRQIVGDERFEQLQKQGLYTNENGLYPMVYRIDMRKAENYLIGQSFRLRNKDVLYLSRHPSADFMKFMQFVGMTVGTARGTIALDNQF